MHRVEFCHGIRYDPVLLEQAYGLVTGGEWVGGKAPCAQLLLHSCFAVTVQPPSPCPLGWGSPYFRSLGSWEGEKQCLLQAGLWIGAGLSVSMWGCGLGV